MKASDRNKKQHACAFRIHRQPSGHKKNRMAAASVAALIGAAGLLAPVLSSPVKAADRIQEQTSTKTSDKPTEFETVIELGKLDMPPIEADDLGWIIVRNGKYGLVDAEGNIIQEPERAGWTMVDDIMTGGQKACVWDYDENKVPIYQSLPDGNHCGGYGGVRNARFYSLVNDKTVHYYEGGFKGQKEGRLSLSELKKEIDKPILLVKGEFNDYSVQEHFTDQPYYIFNPADGKLHGPYQPEQVSAFGIRNLTTSGFDTISQLAFYEQAISPFYSKESSSQTKTSDAKNSTAKNKSGKETYTLYSKDGKTSKSGYSNPVVVSRDLIGASDQNGRYVLFDEKLKPLYTADVECGAKTIDGLTPIQKNGKWVLAKEKNSDYDKKKAADAAFFEQYAGWYGYVTDPEAVSFILNEDGTFSYNRGTKEYDPETGRTKMLSGEASGKLKRVTDSTGQDSLVVGSLTKKTMADSESSFFPLDSRLIDDLKKGTVFKIYQPGEKLSDLPVSQSWISMSGYAHDGTKLTSPAVYCKDTGVMLGKSETN